MTRLKPCPSGLGGLEMGGEKDGESIGSGPRTGDCRFVRCAQNDKQKDNGKSYDNDNGKSNDNGETNNQYKGPSLRSRMTAKNRQRRT
jgi:hypothetical protein